jgi:hypothetical protein
MTYRSIARHGVSIMKRAFQTAGPKGTAVPSPDEDLGRVVDALLGRHIEVTARRGASRLAPVALQAPPFAG